MQTAVAAKKPFINWLVAAEIATNDRAHSVAGAETLFLDNTARNVRTRLASDAGGRAQGTASIM